MAYTDLHVNGPAIIQVQTTQTGSYLNLGVTVEGPNIELDSSHEQIFGDDFGPFLPTDVQYFGELAKLETEFIRWDDATMRQVEGRLPLSLAGENNAFDIGTLVKHPTELGTGQNYFALRYTSSARRNLPREPFREFFCVYPVSVISFRVGTRVTRKTVSWQAIQLANQSLYSFG